MVTGDPFGRFAHDDADVVDAKVPERSKSIGSATSVGG
jgi:hypothetical protein